jgi:hypothetical protein
MKHSGQAGSIILGKDYYSSAELVFELQHPSPTSKQIISLTPMLGGY